MEFKDYTKEEDKIIGSPEASSNIREEFEELLHSESQKKFEQPKPNKLFFYFAGTVKKLKQLINKKK